MARLTLDTAAGTLFGAAPPANGGDVEAALQVLSDTAFRESTSPVARPDWLPLPAKRRKRWAIGVMDQLVVGLVSRARGTKDEGDLLSTVVEQHRGEARAIRDDAMSLLIAEHETSGALLTHTFATLAEHPGWLARVAEELARVLSARPDDGRPGPPRPHPWDRRGGAAPLPARLLPVPPPGDGRRYPRRRVDPGGHLVQVIPYALHRDPRWLTNPDTFDPGRFLGEPTWPRYAYLPFGAGLSVCIGRELRADGGLPRRSNAPAALAPRERRAPALHEPEVLPVPPQRAAHALAVRRALISDEAVPGARRRDEAAFLRSEPDVPVPRHDAVEAIPQGPRQDRGRAEPAPGSSEVAEESEARRGVDQGPTVLDDEIGPVEVPGVEAVSRGERSARRGPRANEGQACVPLDGEEEMNPPAAQDAISAEYNDGSTISVYDHGASDIDAPCMERASTVDGIRMYGARLSRSAWLGISIALLGTGLVWRLVPLGLGSFPLKYGGSVLWGAMVYGISAALLPSRSIAATATFAGAAALATELLRLLHQPWLDAFRLTLPGALLLGRIFSPWNLVAYALGIGAAALCERLAARDRRG